MSKISFDERERGVGRRGKIDIYLPLLSFFLNGLFIGTHEYFKHVVKNPVVDHGQRSFRTWPEVSGRPWLAFLLHVT